MYAAIAQNLVTDAAVGVKALPRLNELISA